MCSSLAVRPMQFDASIFFFRLDGCVFLILFKSEAGSENRTNARRTHTERERGVQYYMCAVAPSLAQWGVSSSSSSCPGKIYFLKKGNVYPKRRRRVIRLQRRAHFFCFLFFKKGNIEKLKLVGNPLFKFWFDFANKMRNESLSHSYFPICASFLDLSRTRFVFNVNNLLHQMKFRLFCFFYVGRKCNEPHPFGLMLLK